MQLLHKYLDFKTLSNLLHLLLSRDCVLDMFSRDCAHFQICFQEIVHTSRYISNGLYTLLDQFSRDCVHFQICFQGIVHTSRNVSNGSCALLERFSRDCAHFQICFQGIVHTSRESCNMQTLRSKIELNNCCNGKGKRKAGTSILW